MLHMRITIVPFPNTREFRRMETPPYPRRFTVYGNRQVSWLRASPSMPSRNVVFQWPHMKDCLPQASARYSGGTAPDLHRSSLLSRDAVFRGKPASSPVSLAIQLFCFYRLSAETTCGCNSINAPFGKMPVSILYAPARHLMILPWVTSKMSCSG
jgi:hypothetical protein